ncbi:MAG: tetratricopeptide repeat protein [Planctomycetota bacterium]
MTPMTSPLPIASRPRRAGGAAGLWLAALAALLAAILVAALALIPTDEPPPPPHTELPDNASPDDCWRFAQHQPALFDRLQPVQDPALLVAGGGPGDRVWERRLETYRSVVLGPDSGPSPRQQRMRLDYLGRQDVAGAWDVARDLNESLTRRMTKAPPEQIRKQLEAFDLGGARRSVLELGNMFDDTLEWLQFLEDLRNAAETQGRGLNRLHQAETSDGPPFVPTQLTLAYVEIARGRPDDARARCEALLASDPPLAPAAEVRTRYGLARALELSGRLPEAIQQVRQILAAKPARVEDRLRLAELYLEARRDEDASALADAVLEASREHPRGNYVKGLACLRLGRFDEAAERLSVARRLLPDDRTALFQLALAEEKAGRHASAFADFVEAANAGYRPAWTRLAAAASALADRRRAGQIASVAQQVIEWLPWLDRSQTPKNERRLLWEYALRFWTAAGAWGGEYDRVRRTAGTLLRVAEDRGRANYIVAGALAARRYVAADAPLALSRRDLAFFNARADKEPSAKYCLAFLLAAVGGRPQARRVLADLVSEHPDYTLARLHLARFYVLDGKTERAARILERAGGRPSPHVRRALATVRKLQGQTLEPNRAAADAAASEHILGPHLVFFANAAYDDPVAFARLIVLLDPENPAADRILQSTYSQVRRHGAKGIRAAARADPAAELAVRRAVASYTTGEGPHRLVVGRFWDDLPGAR